MINETLAGNLAPQTPGPGYLLGYNSSGLGTIILLGTNLTLVGNTLNATGGGGTGTVTSVAFSPGSSGLTVSGSPITGAGTITINGGILTVPFGGNGIGTYTIGDILQATGATTLTKLAAVAAGNVLLSGGVATVSSWGKVNLTAHVSNILPVANGGIGLGGSYNIGDLPYVSGPFAFSMRPIGSTGQVLTVVGGQPAWANATGGGSGTVTSVALAAPSLFSVTGSPITTTGTLTLALATQAANTFLGGPISGAVAVPTMRLLTLTDLPFEVVEIVSGSSYLFTAADNKKTKYFSNAAGCSTTIPAGLPVGWTTGAFRGVGAGTVSFSSSGTLESAGVTLDTEKTGAYIIHRGSDIHLVAGAVGTAGGGSGITNSAANSELAMSDGTNLVPSGVFVKLGGAFVTANLTLGSNVITGNRSITATNSTSTAQLSLLSDGGVFNMGAPGGGSITTLQTSATGSSKPGLELKFGGIGSGNIPAFRFTSTTAPGWDGSSNTQYLMNYIANIASQTGTAAFSMHSSTLSIGARTSTGKAYLFTYGIGGLGDLFNLTSNAVLEIVNAPTAPTTGITSTNQIYAKQINSSSELFVRNEAGMETCLSTLQFNRQTANYVLVLTDAGKDVEMNNASANTVTVPLNATTPFPIGTVIGINQYGAGQTALVAAGGVSIRSNSGFLKIGSRYSGAVLKKVGIDEWYLQGNLVA